MSATASSRPVDVFPLHVRFRSGRVRRMEPRSVEDVLNREAAGEPMKFLFFWGHRPTRSGEIGKGCLSQWWECAFTVDGVAYRSAEHCMMAAKARLFGDDKTAARIVAAGHPKEAKDLGRRVEAF